MIKISKSKFKSIHKSQVILLKIAHNLEGLRIYNTQNTQFTYHTFTLPWL